MKHYCATEHIASVFEAVMSNDAQLDNFNQNQMITMF